MAAKLSLFMPDFQLLWKKFSNTIFSSKSDEMTVVWPNDSWTLTFYAIFSNSVPNWRTFDLMFSLKKYNMTAVWQLNFHSLSHILSSIPNQETSVNKFLIQCWI